MSAETFDAMTHVPSLRLRASAGVFSSWTWVRSATDSNGIACCVTLVGGESPAETLRRGDMSHQPLRLRVSAGFFSSWTWVRSATDSNAIARCVTSTGGESPAETLRRGDMGHQPLRLRPRVSLAAFGRALSDARGVWRALGKEEAFRWGEGVRPGRPRSVWGGTPRPGSAALRTAALRTGGGNQTRRLIQTRKASVTPHACASQPRCRCGRSPSITSGI